MRHGVVGRAIGVCVIGLSLGLFGRADLASQSAASIGDLFDRYRNGEFDVASRLAAADPPQVRASFIAAADDWIARDSTDVINWRLVATAFGIELAHARLANDNANLMVLLDWARKEWQKGQPTVVERLWSRAAVALIGRGGLMSASRPGGRQSVELGGKFLDDAIKRFPDDARLRFAKLVWLPPTALRNFGPIERLTEHPEIGPDALVELAYLNFYFDGDLKTARRLAEQAAGRAAEPSTRYLAHFILGAVGERQGRHQDAAQEYAAALSEVPHAQSASIALAQLLIRDNQAEAAFDLLNRTVTERPDGDDPWRLFAYGAYVRWPVLIADVRKAIR